MVVSKTPCVARFHQMSARDGDELASFDNHLAAFVKSAQAGQTAL